MISSSNNGYCSPVNWLIDPLNLDHRDRTRFILLCVEGQGVMDNSCNKGNDVGWEMEIRMRVTKP